jgi:hypothetical protein
MMLLHLFLHNDRPTVAEPVTNANKKNLYSVDRNGDGDKRLKGVKGTEI